MVIRFDLAEKDLKALKNAMKNYKKARNIMEDLLNLIAVQEKRQKEQEENKHEVACLK